MSLAVSAASRAVAQFAADDQIAVLHEEMAELQIAISHERRGRGDRRAVAEEAADVIIMAIQIGLIYGGRDELSNALRTKTAKLSERLEEQS